MSPEKLIELYNKERNFQKDVFGEYNQIEALNFASFLLFLKAYIDKAFQAYIGKWDTELPPWLTTTIEYEQDGTCPIKAYEEVVKIMALAGAALETYAQIDIEKWREDKEIDISKWKD